MGEGAAGTKSESRRVALHLNQHATARQTDQSSEAYLFSLSGPSTPTTMEASGPATALSPYHSAAL